MKQRKHIYVLATGGTIAGQAESGAATTGYRAGAVSVDALLSAVPELSEIAEVSGEQVAAIDSKDMTEQIQWELVRRCRELLTAGGADGIVITHGTDTMEETAYFLSLLVDTEKPIVLTGAMRPATALSADGPLNLLDAVRVAASDVAGGMGVLVVMNNQIDGAHDVTKTHTMSVDTFRSPDSGALGRVNDGEVTFSGALFIRRCRTARLCPARVLPCRRFVFCTAMAVMTELWSRRRSAPVRGESSMRGWAMAVCRSRWSRSSLPLSGRESSRFAVRAAAAAA